MIFEEQSTIEHMVFRILTHTQSLIQCQRVQVNTIFFHARSFAVSRRRTAAAVRRSDTFIISPCSQVLLLHEASKASFSRVFDLEANDLQGKDDERTR